MSAGGGERTSTRCRVALALGVTVLVAVALASLVTGTAALGTLDSLNALGTLALGGDAGATASLVLLGVRAPRVVAGACCGAALACSLLLQASLDNDLASPGVMGVNSGRAVLARRRTAGAGRGRRQRHGVRRRARLHTPGVPGLASRRQQPRHRGAGRGGGLEPHGRGHRRRRDHLARVGGPGCLHPGRPLRPDLPAACPRRPRDGGGARGGGGPGPRHRPSRPGRRDGARPGAQRSCLPARRDRVCGGPRGLRGLGLRAPGLRGPDRPPTSCACGRSRTRPRLALCAVWGASLLVACDLVALPVAFRTDCWSTWCSRSGCAFFISLLVRRGRGRRSHSVAAARGGDAR